MEDRPRSYSNSHRFSPYGASTTKTSSTSVTIGGSKLDGDFGSNMQVPHNSIENLVAAVDGRNYGKVSSLLDEMRKDIRGRSNTFQSGIKPSAMVKIANHTPTSILRNVYNSENHDEQSPNRIAATSGVASHRIEVLPVVKGSTNDSVPTAVVTPTPPLAISTKTASSSYQSAPTKMNGDLGMLVQKHQEELAKAIPPSDTMTGSMTNSEFVCSNLDKCHSITDSLINICTHIKRNEPLDPSDVLDYGPTSVSGPKNHRGQNATGKAENPIDDTLESLAIKMTKLHSMVVDVVRR